MTMFQNDPKTCVMVLTRLSPRELPNHQGTKSYKSQKYVLPQTVQQVNG